MAGWLAGWMVAHTRPPGLAAYRIATNGCDGCIARAVLHGTGSASLDSSWCEVLMRTGGAALSALLKVAGTSLRALNLNGAFGTEEVSHEFIVQSCPRLALLDDKGRVRKH